MSEEKKDNIYIICSAAFETDIDAVYKKVVGKKNNAVVKGVNIIRMNDGTLKKTIVKQTIKHIYYENSE